MDTVCVFHAACQFSLATRGAGGAEETPILNVVHPARKVPILPLCSATRPRGRARCTGNGGRPPFLPPAPCPRALLRMALATAQVIDDGALQLVVSVKEDHYEVVYRDGASQWTVPHIPIPDDFILHVGIVSGGGRALAPALGPHGHPTPPGAPRIFVDLKAYHADKQPNSEALGRPLRGSGGLGGACQHRGHTVHPSFHRKVIYVCEAKDEDMDDDGMHKWGKHQRDNTIGLEKRLFTVDGNGRDVAVHGRHASLSYRSAMQ